MVPRKSADCFGEQEVSHIAGDAMMSGDEEDFDDNLISLDDLESEDEEGEDHYDWGDELDDMDSGSWEKHYGDEDEELEGDPWDLN